MIFFTNTSNHFAKTSIIVDEKGKSLRQKRFVSSWEEK